MSRPTYNPFVIERDYQECVHCILDTSDPEIEFDAEGVCNHCRPYTNLAPSTEQLRQLQRKKLGVELQALVSQIKSDGVGKAYDCAIGVSGGVDSSYVAWLVKDLGLRPLAIHLDNGWNSELAVKNIHTVLEKLDIDLYTHVLDWDSFRDLQLAFLKASTPDSEIPTDHAIFALNYEIPAKHGIKYFLNGCNTQTECIMPQLWSQGHFDWTYIRSVHSLFGTKPLKKFPKLSWIRKKRYVEILGIQSISILEYIDYRKLETLEFLKSELGWRPYSTKHGESIYTKFFQQYILPKKFGFDKRRAHLSNLIVNGEQTREQALVELARSEPPPRELQNDKEFVVKKLGISMSEFEDIMALPPKTIHDYPNENHSPLAAWADQTFQKATTF